MEDEVQTGWLRRLWAGDIPLAEAFWWYGIAYGIIANVGLTIAALAIVTLDGPIWLVVVVDVLPIPYNVLVFVGVWRSAARWQGEPRWAALARIAIAVWFVVAIVF